MFILHIFYKGHNISKIVENYYEIIFDSHLFRRIKQPGLNADLI
jgi:hypothetical protein